MRWVYEWRAGTPQSKSEREIIQTNMQADVADSPIQSQALKHNQFRTPMYGKMGSGDQSKEGAVPPKSDVEEPPDAPRNTLKFDKPWRIR